MSRIMLATISSTFLANHPSPAVSDDGQSINRESERRWQEMQLPASAGFANVFDELADVAQDCSASGWDGYDAAAVLPETIAEAKRFVQSLPPGLSPPSVGAEPDGHVTFEWHFSARRTLSISISPDGNLHYAALLGLSRRYGTEPFLGHLPVVLVQLIHEVRSR